MSGPDPGIEGDGGAAAARAVRAALHLRAQRRRELELAWELWSGALPRMDERIERALRQAFEVSYCELRWARLVIVLPQPAPPALSAPGDRLVEQP